MNIRKSLKISFGFQGKNQYKFFYLHIEYFLQPWLFSSFPHLTYLQLAITRKWQLIHEAIWRRSFHYRTNRNCILIFEPVKIERFVTIFIKIYIVIRFKIKPLKVEFLFIVMSYYQNMFQAITSEIW